MVFEWGGGRGSSNLLIKVRVFSGFAYHLRSVALWKSFCSSSPGRAVPSPATTS